MSVTTPTTFEEFRGPSSSKFKRVVKPTCNSSLKPSKLLFISFQNFHTHIIDPLARPSHHLPFSFVLKSGKRERSAEREGVGILQEKRRESISRIRGTETGCTHDDVTSKRWVNRKGRMGASAERFAFPVFAIISLAHHRGKLGLDGVIVGWLRLEKEMRASRDARGAEARDISIRRALTIIWTMDGKEEDNGVKYNGARQSREREREGMVR